MQGFSRTNNAVDASVIAIIMLYTWQFVRIATGIGQGPPTKGNFGWELPQLSVQLNKLISCKIFEGLLQKRVIGVKVKAVNEVERCFKRIWIVTVRKTNAAPPFEKR